MFSTVAGVVPHCSGSLEGSFVRTASTQFQNESVTEVTEILAVGAASLPGARLDIQGVERLKVKTGERGHRILVADDPPAALTALSPHRAVGDLER